MDVLLYIYHCIFVYLNTKCLARMVILNYLRALSAVTYKNKIIFAIASILIAAFVIDTSLIKTSMLTTSQSGSTTRINFFIIILSITIVGQFLILRFVRQETNEIRRKKELHINTIHNVVTIFQSIITGILIFIILQIVLTSQYNIHLLIAALSGSYLLAITMMALLTRRFFLWLKLYRNSVILSYGLASAIVVINIGAALFFVDLTLQNNQPENIAPHLGENIPFLTPGSVSSNLNTTSNVLSIVSFMMMWVATCILLRHYSRRLGKVKFWILVGIPLIYFLSQFITVSLNLFSPLLSSSQTIFYGIILTLMFTFSKSAGGILFGLAFWIVARNIHQSSSVVRNYMVISGFGLVLLFTSNQANVLVTGPYPPFGLAAASFVGLSSYLVLVGIYSSAISVAQDTKLRKTIRKSAIEESKLLVSIGSAQMEQEIQNRAIKVAKEQRETMTEQTGVQSSLTDHDMKQYVSKVLKEIHVLQNIDDILKKGKEILETSTEFLVCSKVGGIRLVYNNYFKSYEKVMQEYSKGGHKGIRLVTSIDRDSIDIVRKFLSIGVQVRHVKNMPPIDFAVSDKEMIATIERMESGQMIQNLLVSTEQPYIDHFTSIFDELWKNGVDAKDRIKTIEEGVDTEGIEIIQNPAEIQKIIFNLLKSAAEEILIVFATANAFHRQEYLGAMQFLKEAANQRGVKIRILTPADDLIVQTAQRWKGQQQEQEEEGQQQKMLEQQKIDIRFIESYLQTNVSLLIVDRKFSLAVELKDDAAHMSYEAMGLATYSNSKPTVHSYVSIFGNLWQQTELYEQLKIHNKMQTELYERLQEVDKAKDEFINIAAHELRTPIQPIIGLSDVLHSRIKDSEQQEFLDIIIRNARRLQQLTEDVLDVTRIESRNLKLRKEKVSLNEIISNTISDYRNQLVKENKNNTLKLELVNLTDKGKDIIIEADKSRISQVISNLLSNAIKFTNEGAIIVSTERNANDVLVSIKDTGTGIDSDVLPQLFTKFTTKSTTGTGLGLFISKSIIEAHDGRIWAENNKDGNGATFYFRIPISK